MFLSMGPRWLTMREQKPVVLNVEENEEPWQGNERRKDVLMENLDHDIRMLNSPFWRVMVYIFVGLLAIATWMLKTSIEKTQQVSDNQIEMKTMLKGLTDQFQRNQDDINQIKHDIEQLKLSDRSQQERLDTLQGNRSH